MADQSEISCTLGKPLHCTQGKPPRPKMTGGFTVGKEVKTAKSLFIAGLLELVFGEGGLPRVQRYYSYCDKCKEERDHELQEMQKSIKTDSSPQES